MIAFLRKNFVSYPIATWTMVGVTAYWIKIAAISELHRETYAKNEVARTAELNRV